MRVFSLSEAIDMLQTIDDNIESALADEVTAKARELIKQEVLGPVYDYPAQPTFSASRRGESGGIADPNNIDGDVYGLTLQLTDNAQLQNLWSEKWSADVASIVQAGTTQFHQPYPRPFLEDAIRDGIADGQIDQALKDGLERSGIAVD